MFLIVLACFGVGLSGGIPIPTASKRNLSPDVKVELLETKKKDQKLKKGEIN